MQTEYKIIKAQNIFLLEDLVNEFLSRGFICVGSPTIDSLSMLCYQAVVFTIAKPRKKK